MKNHTKQNVLYVAAHIHVFLGVIALLLLWVAIPETIYVPFQGFVTDPEPPVWFSVPLFLLVVTAMGSGFYIHDSNKCARGSHDR